MDSVELLIIDWTDNGRPSLGPLFRIIYSYSNQIVSAYFPFFYVQYDCLRLIPTKPTYIWHFPQIPQMLICSRYWTRPTIMLLNMVPYVFFVQCKRNSFSNMSKNKHIQCSIHVGQQRKFFEHLRITIWKGLDQRIILFEQVLIITYPTKSSNFVLAWKEIARDNYGD